MKKTENLRGQRRGHSFKNLVRFHQSAVTMTASAGSSNPSGLQFRDRQRGRRVGLNFPGETVGHIREEQDPKSERDAEKRKLQGEWQRINDRHERSPNRPGRE